MLFSFNDSTILTFPLEGFTTQWYTKALADPGLRKALSNSFGVAFVGGAALPASWGRSRRSGSRGSGSGGAAWWRAWSARRSCCPG